MTSEPFEFWCRIETPSCYFAYPGKEAAERIGKPSPDAKLVARFAEPPRNAQSAPWCQIDAQLSPEHRTREIRQAMTHLDLTSLYNSYAGRGKVPYRPDLMLAVVLFELRRGQRQPSPDSYPQRHESRSEEEKRSALLRRRASVWYV